MFLYVFYVDALYIIPQYHLPLLFDFFLLPYHFFAIIDLPHECVTDFIQMVFLERTECNLQGRIDNRNHLNTGGTLLIYATGFRAVPVGIG